jgi:hypothetical protein
MACIGCQSPNHHVALIGWEKRCEIDSSPQNELRQTRTSEAVMTTVRSLFRCALAPRSLASLAAACVLIGTASLAVAQQSFKTPEDAVGALFAAAKSGDNNAALTVFGPEGAGIISSGDPVQ